MSVCSSSGSSQPCHKKREDCSARESVFLTRRFTLVSPNWPGHLKASPTTLSMNAGYMLAKWVQTTITTNYVTPTINTCNLQHLRSLPVSGLMFPLLALGLLPVWWVVCRYFGTLLVPCTTVCLEEHPGVTSQSIWRKVLTRLVTNPAPVLGTSNAQIRNWEVQFKCIEFVWMSVDWRMFPGSSYSWCLQVSQYEHLSHL